MTLLAQMICDSLKASDGLIFPVTIVDQILKERNRILKEDENYGPGFNRDTVGYRTDENGKTVRYIKNNPR